MLYEVITGGHLLLQSRQSPGEQGAPGAAELHEEQAQGQKGSRAGGAGDEPQEPGEGGGEALSGFPPETAPEQPGESYNFV